MRKHAVLLPALLAFLVGAEPALAWTWPADGPVLQPFDYRGDSYAGGQHRGVDIGAEPAAPIAAPAAGVVTFAGSVPHGGRTVTVRTPDGYAVTLVHLGAILVSKGAVVNEGDAVGTAGPSGEPEVSAPYVHLGVRLASDPGGYLDPLALLPARAAETPPLGGTAVAEEGDAAMAAPDAAAPSARSEGSQPAEAASAGGGEGTLAPSDAHASSEGTVIAGAASEVFPPVPADGDSAGAGVAPPTVEVVEPASLGSTGTLAAAAVPEGGAGNPKTAWVSAGDAVLVGTSGAGGRAAARSPGAAAAPTTRHRRPRAERARSPRGFEASQNRVPVERPAAAARLADARPRARQTEQGSIPELVVRRRGLPPGTVLLGLGLAVVVAVAARKALAGNARDDGELRADAPAVSSVSGGARIVAVDGSLRPRGEPPPVNAATPLARPDRNVRRGGSRLLEQTCRGTGGHARLRRPPPARCDPRRRDRDGASV